MMIMMRMKMEMKMLMKMKMKMKMRMRMRMKMRMRMRMTRGVQPPPSLARASPSLPSRRPGYSAAQWSSEHAWDHTLTLLHFYTFTQLRKLWLQFVFKRCKLYIFFL